MRFAFVAAALSLSATPSLASVALPSPTAVGQAVVLGDGCSYIPEPAAGQNVWTLIAAPSFSDCPPYIAPRPKPAKIAPDYVVGVYR